MNSEEDRQLSICIVAPSLQLGGLENSVSVMANFLVGRGHRVSLVLCYKTEKFYKLDRRIEIFEPSFSKNSYLKVHFYLKWIGFVRKKVCKFEADVILSYGDFHNALVLSAMACTREPVVISDRASPSLKFSLPVRVMRRVMYKHAAGIIAQTSRAMNSQRRISGSTVPIEVIPNPVRSLSCNTSGDRQEIIIAVARHYFVKGLDRLLFAFSQSDADDWILLIEGSEGPETQTLKSLANRLGIAHRVRFLGPVAQIGELYNRAEIFVLPSRSEGFPNALIEAMVSGCAVISFDIDAGPSEVIRDGENGVLVENDDIPAMADAISRLARNAKLRSSLGAEARKIGSDLSLTKLGMRLESFLFSVVDSKDRQHKARIGG